MSAVLWKVCGITRAADAEEAVRLGADAIGFVFWAGSPRAISVEAAAAIGRDLPAGVRKVGVFVDATAEELREAAETADLDFIQLSGDEPPAACAAAPKPAWKALRLPPGTAATAAEALAAPYADCTLLIDAGVPGEYGGTGQAADWSAAARLAAHHRVVLAGGLRPDNVAAAIEQVGPWGVDVASGVEAAPGRKDPDKLRRFAAALEAYR
ncbi:MAG TPA: phosphoribosylanthranilate isomerase [Acidobacteriota bacterium]